MAEWFVAKSSEMKDGDRRIVTAGKREIGVFHKDGAFYAYSNNCLHQGGPACEGILINNVVDVSNYVMLETNQPNHAYDLDSLGGGGFRIRMAADGETLVTLDDVEKRAFVTKLLDGGAWLFSPYL